MGGLQWSLRFKEHTVNYHLSSTHAPTYSRRHYVHTDVLYSLIHACRRPIQTSLHSFIPNHSFIHQSPLPTPQPQCHPLQPYPHHFHPHHQGRRPRETGGTVPPKKFDVGDGPCIRPPNILRRSVVGCARKYEQSKKGVFLVRKGSYTTVNIVKIRKLWEKKGNSGKPGR